MLSVVSRPFGLKRSSIHLERSPIHGVFKRFAVWLEWRLTTWLERWLASGLEWFSSGRLVWWLSSGLEWRLSAALERWLASGLEGSTTIRLILLFLLLIDEASDRQECLVRVVPLLGVLLVECGQDLVNVGILPVLILVLQKFDQDLVEAQVLSFHQMVQVDALAQWILVKVLLNAHVAATNRDHAILSTHLELLDLSAQQEVIILLIEAHYGHESLQYLPKRL